MAIRTSEVGYTIATTRRETTKVHKNMWWGGGKNIYIYIYMYIYIYIYSLKGNAVGFHLKNQSVDVVSRNKCCFFMNYIKCTKNECEKYTDFNVERFRSYNV